MSGSRRILHYSCWEPNWRKLELPLHQRRERKFDEFLKPDDTADRTCVGGAASLLETATGKEPARSIAGCRSFTTPYQLCGERSQCSQPGVAIESGEDAGRSSSRA